MTGERLIFHGLAWPTAKVVPASKTGPPLLTAPSGQGRAWQADAAEGFWRDFADLDLSDAGGLVAFVRRRGDPEGLLNRPGASADAGRWQTPLHEGLRRFAACWSKADKQGVSPCRRDDTVEWWRESREAHDAVEFWRLSLFPAVAPQVEVFPALEGGPGLALRAKTLGAFMSLSAAMALERGVSMRRCRYCRSWFELRRKDMKFCSGTCRAALANKQKVEE